MVETEEPTNAKSQIIHSDFKRNHIFPFYSLLYFNDEMKDRCPKSVGDAKQTLEIRVELRGAVINMSTYTLISKVSGGK